MATETATHTVVMPAMGDSVAEGTVLEWHKHEGESVTADETLVDISTDKVDAEVPAPVSGTLVKIHAAEGETVAVGAPLAEIASNGAAEPAPPADAPPSAVIPPRAEPAPPAEPPPSAVIPPPVEAPRPLEAPPAVEAAPPVEVPPAAEVPPPAVVTVPVSAAGETIDIVTPGGGESVSEGTILEWSVKVGDTVSDGDTVVEISTDKIDMELPAPADGTITEILAQSGETVTVGQVIARMTTGAPQAGGTPAPAPTEEPARPVDAQGPAGASTVRAGAEQPAGTPAVSAGAGASPVAQRVAAAEGVNLAGVHGSARGGRITKADVLAAAGNGAAAAGRVEPIKGAAAALARYMEESRAIPTATSFRTMTVSTLAARREQLKEAGHRVSFTHLIAYAIARAAAFDMPVMTNHFLERDGVPHRVEDGAVNLGLAVDVERKDGSRGLLVPVIRNAGALTFRELLDSYNALVEKARTNALSPDELVGANLTLTNPGGLGTVASVPRLMVGQGTIIATGSIAYPVGLGRVAASIGAEKVMTVTSTYDHRIIQGAESGRFLARIEEYLQGADGFYEAVFSSLGAALPALRPVTAPTQGPPLTAAAPAAAAPAPADMQLLQAVQSATSLLKAHRTHGHLAAHLDPLGRIPEGDPSLDPAALGLTDEIMAKIPSSILRMWVPGETLAESLPYLHATYCGPIAYEIEHIASHRQRLWLREAIETGRYRQPLSASEQKWLLERLTQVDALERFMHKAYLGQKQFSVEGLDATVPMIDEIVRLSGAAGAREVVLGMAHRGRLNVLAHNLGRPYDTIFAEFEGSSTLEPITTIPQGGTGDVKYHHGAEGIYQLASGESIIVRLESNPSHLEFVAPVASGATRAAQTTRQGPHAHQDTNAAIPLVLHGDASFPGQGVVAETLNLQALDGYTVGGTIHIIQNNQVGFTTDPEDGRSTTMASDLAKGFDVPIIHVNADAVDACIAAVRLAFAFRQEFGHDVLIDLIGYRRFGHNEADEPAYTQPEMYRAIRNHPPVRELFARSLIEQGVVTEQESTEMTDRVWAVLTEQHQLLKERMAHAKEVEHATGEYQLDRTPSPEVNTAVPIERLKVLNEELLAVPDGFTVHPKLVTQLGHRREALEQGPAGTIIWAHAEALAFASLLTEGIPIRLTGQDAERGTFSQRHLVLHDPTTGREHCAIQHLPGALAPMELHNSPLSETACLGFEYGYSQEGPETLVLWEAQYGDFVNVAQVMIDQFIVSGLAKWGQTSRLTLLLPHGYEGSGPEHSSGRLERFLQLAAEGNIRVANLTTPAQYFHLLRRQARIAKQRPLVIMTPKSLLRMAQASSTVDELAEGRFQPSIADDSVDPEGVSRLILCTGKIYYDIIGHASRPEAQNVAVGRVELLYPFPQAEILRMIGSYPQLREVVWVQEEPRNMGARAHMSARMRQIMPGHLHFGYVGRPERAASGEGYPVAHAIEQDRIASTALDTSRSVSQHPMRMPGER
jgi:2-oxoglutarate dehydrogenase E1 component